MRIRRGPAAVTRDESRTLPLPPNGREGAAGRMIGEPEDLPVRYICMPTFVDQGRDQTTEDESGSPGFDGEARGFFLPLPRTREGSAMLPPPRDCDRDESR